MKIALTTILLIVVLLATGLYLQGPEWRARTAQSSAIGQFPASTADSGEILLQGQLAGPNKLWPLADGQWLTGLADHRIARFAPPAGPVETATIARGRPRAVQPSPGSGGFVLADSSLGLAGLRKHKPRVLSNGTAEQAAGRVMDFAIGTDGIVWYLDGSAAFGDGRAFEALLARPADGRLLKYDGSNGDTSVALGGLDLPFGLLLDERSQSLLISEFATRRILRVQLNTPNSAEVFAASLPGYPAYLSAAPNGGVWVALYGPPMQSLEASATYPRLREWIWRLPRALQPRPARRAQAVLLDANGVMVRGVDFPSEMAPIVSAVERDGSLWMAGPEADGLLRVPLD